MHSNRILLNVAKSVGGDVLSPGKPIHNVEEGRNPIANSTNCHQWKNLAVSDAGDLISTIFKSSKASTVCGTSGGCRQVSPGYKTNASSPMVVLSLPLIT